MKVARVLGHRYAAALIAASIFVLLLLMREPVSPNADTLRDFLIARDCLDGSQCHTAGAPAGLGGFQQHATWIWILVGARLLHLGIAGLQALAFAGDALAAALVFLMARRFMSPGYALLAAGADALAIRALVPTHVLHNPSFLPLATTLVFWAALRLVDRRRLGDVALVALFVALSLELHGIGALLVVALVVWIGLAQDAPGTAAALAAAVIIGVPAVVSRVALVANVGIAQSHSMILVGSVGCVAVLALGVGLRRRFDALPDRPRMWAWLGVGLTYPLLVVALVTAFHENYLPYYFLPALPPLAIGTSGALAAVAERARARTLVVWVERSVVACFAFVVLTSVTASATRGLWSSACPGRFELDQLAVLPAHFAAQGIGYQEAFLRVQGEPHDAVVASFAAFEPRVRPGQARSGPLLNLFPMRPDAVPAGVEHFAIPGRAVAAVVRVSSWLDREHATVCTAPADGSAAQSCLTTALVPATSALAMPPALAARAYPRVEEIERAMKDGRLHEWPQGTRISFRYNVGVGDGAGRTLFLRDQDQPCPWRITRVTGIASTGTVPGARVVLGRDGAPRGTLAVSRLMGVPACPGDHVRLPPALFEIARSDKPAQQLLERCAP